MQHGGAEVGNFLTLAVNHTSVIAFFLFTGKRTKTDKILLSMPHMRNIQGDPQTTQPYLQTCGKKWKPNEKMPTGNSTQLEHAPVRYAKNEKDISSRRSLKTVLCVVHVKMSFSQNERVFIVRVYYETRSYKSVREQFTKKFVGREPLTKLSICRLMQKFESTGNVGNAGYQRTLTVLIPAHLEEVATVYEKTPSLSLRRGTQQLDISYGSL